MWAFQTATSCNLRILLVSSKEVGLEMVILPYAGVILEEWAVMGGKGHSRTILKRWC